MGVKNQDHLAQVKRTLADKYDRLARCASSRNKRKQFKTRSDRFRRQAAQLAQG